jgi:glutamate dehydrogenase
VAEIAENIQLPLQDVSDIHAAVAERLGLTQLRRQIEALPAESFWQVQARSALGDDLASLQRQIAHDVLNHAPGGDASDKLTIWEYQDYANLDRTQRLLAELGHAKTVDMAMLTVALRELRNLV